VALADRAVEWPGVSFDEVHDAVAVSGLFGVPRREAAERREERRARIGEAVGHAASILFRGAALLRGRPIC
jgi:hypothetical protein